MMLIQKVLNYPRNPHHWCLPPLVDELAHNMTEWEVQKEREEFTKMAALQTQLGKSLSSKFAKEGEGEREKGSKSTSDVSSV